LCWDNNRRLAKLEALDAWASRSASAVPMWSPWRGNNASSHRRVDKLHGETIPLSGRLIPSITLREPQAALTGHIIPWELPDADHPGRSVGAHWPTGQRQRHRAENNRRRSLPDCLSLRRVGAPRGHCRTGALKCGAQKLWGPSTVASRHCTVAMQTQPYLYRYPSVQAA